MLRKFGTWFRSSYVTAVISDIKHRKLQKLVGTTDKKKAVVPTSKNTLGGEISEMTARTQLRQNRASNFRTINTDRATGQTSFKS